MSGCCLLWHVLISTEVVYLQCYLVVTWLVPRETAATEVAYLQCCLVVTWLVPRETAATEVVPALFGCYMAGAT